MSHKNNRTIYVSVTYQSPVAVLKPRITQFILGRCTTHQTEIGQLSSFLPYSVLIPQTIEKGHKEWLHGSSWGCVNLTYESTVSFLNIW